MQLTNSGGSSTNPSYSPDSSKILFANNNEIYLMDANGANVTELDPSGGQNVEPVFSSDGTQIVFVSFRDGNEQLYVMNADGTNPTRLTNNSASDFLPDVGPKTLLPTSVVSQKTHGTAGAFAIPLPLTGTHGVECRSGGAGGNYTLVFAFPNTLTSVSSAAVSSGTGHVQTSGIGSDAHQYLVNLAGVTNAQHLVINLQGVHDSTGSFAASISAPMDVLLGDANGNGSVNSSDVSQTKSRAGQTVTSTNFRSDVTVDGSLNSADVSLVKSKSGTALP
jgi:hypothetical protein